MYPYNDVIYPPSACSVDFGNGCVNYYASGSNSVAVRLVRGGQLLSSFSDNGDGTITDNSTGLMWAKCQIGQTGSNCLGNNGNNSYLDWSTAINTAANSTLAGYNDWRLPNAKELQSIVDYTKMIGINGAYFPNTLVVPFWTSSTDASNPGNSWLVDFNLGSFSNVYSDIRSNYYPVLLVQGGRILSPFSLSINTAGSGIGTVTSSPPGINCGSTCNASYNSGTVVTLTATPAAGSSFGGWSGAGCSGTNACSVTMTAAQNVTATFNHNSYTVTPTAGTGGNVSPSTAQTVNSGTTAQFTITPNSGYATSSTVGGTCPQGSWNTGNTIWTTGAITANCTVNFSFTPITYTVTPSAGTGGTIIPAPRNR